MAESSRARRTRQALIDAAFDEIRRKGFGRASLDDVLKRTGVTKGALYHHFGSKQELGYAVVEEKLGQALLETFLKLRDEDPIGSITGSIRQAVECLGDDEVGLGCPIANLAQEMSPLDEGFRERIDRLYQVWRDELAGMLRRGQQQGRVRQDVDPEEVATFVVASVAGGRVMAKSARDRRVLSACAEQLCTFLENMRP